MIVTLAGYGLLFRYRKNHAQLSVLLSSATKHYLGLQSPVWHRSGATGAADLIFIPFGAPKGHTKHYPITDEMIREYIEEQEGEQIADDSRFPIDNS